MIICEYDMTPSQSLTAKQYTHVIAAAGQALHDFRHDPEVRVIVLTGETEAEFYRVACGHRYEDQGNRDRLNPIKRGASGRFVHGLTAGPNPLEVLALIEKPWWPASTATRPRPARPSSGGCDTAVAREDVIISDVHRGMQEVIDSNGEVRRLPVGGDAGRRRGALRGALDAAQQAQGVSVPLAPMVDEEARGDEHRQLRAARGRGGRQGGRDRRHAPAATCLRARARQAGRTEAADRHWHLHQDPALAHEHLDFFTHAAAGGVD